MEINRLCFLAVTSPSPWGILGNVKNFKAQDFRIPGFPGSSHIQRLQIMPHTIETFFDGVGRGRLSQEERKYQDMRRRIPVCAKKTKTL